MAVVLRSWLRLGFAALGVFIAPFLPAADAPSGDLTPVSPIARALVSDNNPWQFRNYINNNNGSQSPSADGRWLLMSGNGLMLWDLNERMGGQPRTIQVGPVNVFNAAVALSPDGKTAAFAPMYYGGDMAVRFFDTNSGKQIREIDNDQQIFSLAFAPDGQRLAVGTQQHIELWKTDNGEEIRTFSGAQNSNYRRLTFSSDGKMLAALGNEPDTVHIWETASGKERASVHFGSQPTPLAGNRRLRGRIVAANNMNNNAILALGFSADNRLLAVSKQDSAIHLWDLQANREMPPLTGFRGHVCALVFPADGKELIAVDTEGTRLSWRMAALRRNSNVRLAPLDDADFAELWNDLAEPDIFRAYRARRHLAADPTRALPLLTRHLKPVPAGDTARIQQLVKDLSSPNAGTRRKAMTELRTKHGEAALGALMQLNGGGNAAMPGMPGGGGIVMMKGGGNSQAATLLLQKLQMQYDTPEHQRDLLAVRALEEIGTPEVRQTLMKLSKGAAGAALTTEAKAALDRLSAAKSVKAHQATPEKLWTDLSSDDATLAFKAMCSLASAPDQAAVVLGKELKPIPVVEDKEIAGLLDDLNSDDFRIREQATKSLANISEQALPAMKKTLDGPTVPLEVRKRLERLVEQAVGQASAPLLRGLRAVEVLEHSGRDESKQILLALAGGAPQSQLTREAKASLQRMAPK